MRKIIRIIRTHTPKEAMVKIIKRIVLKYKYIRTKKHILSNSYNYNKNFSEFKTKMQFYYNDRDCNRVIDYYEKNREVRSEILNDARMIMDNKFNILGSEIVFEGKNILWNKDFKSGFEWEQQFYKDIQIINTNNDADVKVVWELSRFNHFFSLGKAYWITNDISYYNEFKRQIISWDKMNPYCMSVNWTCTMEVSIRAINWIFGYFHFKKLIDNDSEFNNHLNNLLYYHGKFIYRNLENYNKLRNNHYVSNLVGLLYLGLYFSDKESCKWIKKSIKELHREIDIQINSDGTTYETSTNYQRVVAELFLHAYMIGSLNDIHFKSEYTIKLIKMYDFLINITKPNGLTPLVGDIDNGRLLIISQYYNWDKRDFNQLIEVAGFYLKNKTNSEYQFDVKEELVWLTGKKTSNLKIEQSHAKLLEFPNGGFYLLKNQSFYVLVRCGELSMRGQGGHSHNDQLSFELNVKGYDILIDPGSYTYSGSVELRNADRATNNHNTVSIDGFEQNTFGKDIFSMQEETFSKKSHFDSTCFIGEHYGYKKKANIIHKRKILIDSQNVSIFDSLIGGSGNLNCYQNFILDPEVKIMEKDKKITLVMNELIIFTNMYIYDCIIEDIYVSRGYGLRVMSKKIKKNIKNDAEVRFYLQN